MAINSAVASFTRPSNTDAYTAGDVIGPVTTPALLNFGSVAGAAFAIGAKVLKDSVVVANSTFRLHLYRGTASPTAIADNSPWTNLYANAAKYIGYIDTGTAVTSGSGSDSALAQNMGVMIPLVASSSEGGLWGMLEALAAYVPESAEQFTVTLVTV